MSKSRDTKIDSQKDPKQENVSTSIENAGNYLRTLRLGKGLSIKDVTQATRISETNINAIEDQDFSSLPADTFTRGLLQIYANFLDATPETVIANFMEERDKFTLEKKKRSRHKQSNKILSPKRLAEPTHISSMTMAAILFLIIVLSFAGYCVYTSWNPFSFLLKNKEDLQSAVTNVLQEEKTVTTQEPEEQIIIVPSKKSSQTAAKIEEQLVEMKNDIQPAKYLVTIRFLEDTRVEQIKDDDDTISLEFAAGDTHSLKVNSLLQLTFSQADSAEILVNDINVDFPEIRYGNYTLKIPQDLAETP